MRRAHRNKQDVQLWLSDLDLIRLTLQRTNDWIVGVLQQLAVDQPEALRIERSQYTDHAFVSYYARRLPQD
ncbi:hypothetical protein ACFVMA_18735 [Streptomyces rochei]|uniref:hypothetical protein n=1 Tax=Streptomyces rochei TaxID=1928 RepID=UPI0036788335